MRILGESLQTEVYQLDFVKHYGELPRNRRLQEDWSGVMVCKGAGPVADVILAS
jgi:hypothetical protein